MWFFVKKKRVELAQICICYLSVGLYIGLAKIAEKESQNLTVRLAFFVSLNNLPKSPDKCEFKGLLLEIHSRVFDKCEHFAEG